MASQTKSELKLVTSPFGSKLKKRVGNVFGSFPGAHGSRSQVTDVSDTTMSSREAIAAWHRKNVNVHDFYEVLEIIGRGHMGKVSVVKRKEKAWEKSMKRITKGWEKSTKRSATSSESLDDLHDMLSISLHNKTMSLKNDLFINDNKQLSMTLHSSYKLSSPLNLKSASYELPVQSPRGSSKSAETITKRSDSFLRHYACKTVSTARIKSKDLEMFLNEVSVMRTLDHPNIIALYEIYSTWRKMWLITELCYGGDLRSRDLDEIRVAHVMEQILQGVAHMHKLGICHGDLKLENVLYESPEPDSIIKIIDFGLSQKFLVGEKMNKVCGTIYTVSPEVMECDLQNNGIRPANSCLGYTESSDIWSIGCMAFILLSGGDYPFMNEDSDVMDVMELSKLLQGNYVFGPQWDIRNISDNAKNFIRGTLERVPEKRWSAIEALTFVKEEWISALDVSESPTVTKRKQPITLPLEVFRGMQSYAQYGPLRKTILMAATRTMDKSMLTDLQELFLSMDHHHTGTLSMEDLKVAFVSYFEALDVAIDNMMDLEQIFAAVDTNHSGEVNYSEFLAAVSESQGLITVERLQEAFHRIDTKGKGFISKNDLRVLLGNDTNEDVISKMIEEVGSKDGNISYHEFLRLMLQDA